MKRLIITLFAAAAMVGCADKGSQVVINDQNPVNEAYEKSGELAYKAIEATYNFLTPDQWAKEEVVAVLGVTTSTIDSIAVAMHRMFNKAVGTAVCLAICLAWGLLLDFGVVDIWSHFGIVRVGLALAMLYLGIKQLSR